MPAERKVRALQEVSFENRRLEALGIEPMTLTELRRKATPRHLSRAHRIDFYLLMLVGEGRGHHTIDFVDWPVAPGSLLFTRPGQVQQWHPDDAYDAQLVLIAPSSLPQSAGLNLPRELALLAFDEWRACLDLDADSRAQMETAFRQLRQDFDRFDGSGLDIALIRHILMSILLRMARLQATQSERQDMPAGQRLTYRLFRQAVEAGYPDQHSLRYYARRLGYSESTISRACLAIEGRPAKQVIDRRIALEAQRLLVHSTSSVAEVAHRLGFTEATNFVKFFRRHIGVTPAAFREQRMR